MGLRDILITRDELVLQLINKMKKGHEINLNNSVQKHAKLYEFIKKLRLATSMMSIIGGFYYFLIGPSSLFIASSIMFVYSHLWVLRVKQYLINEMKVSTNDIRFISVLASIDSIEI